MTYKFWDANSFVMWQSHLYHLCNNKINVQQFFSVNVNGICNILVTSLYSCILMIIFSNGPAFLTL